MQAKDIFYGSRYVVKKGFYKDCIGSVKELDTGTTPNRAKLLIDARIQKKMELAMVIDAWIDLSDLADAAGS